MGETSSFAGGVRGNGDEGSFERLEREINRVPRVLHLRDCASASFMSAIGGGAERYARLFMKFRRNMEVCNIPALSRMRIHTLESRAPVFWDHCLTS